MEFLLNEESSLRSLVQRCQILSLCGNHHCTLPGATNKVKLSNSDSILLYVLLVVNLLQQRR